MNRIPRDRRSEQFLAQACTAEAGTGRDARAAMTPGAARGPLLLGGAIAAICVIFAAFTGHAWEDYFITFRSSLNLASGHGLVFQQGERVHTFTSPLGTLLPALFALGDGDRDSVAWRALWCFRLASAVALGTAVWLAARRWLVDRVVPAAVAAAGLACVFDAKMVDFSINGMESAWVVLFVALTWAAFAQMPSTGARHSWRSSLPAAIGLAGLQWTRPDGGVFFGVIAAAWLALGAKNSPRDRQRLAPAIRALLLGMLLYAPWPIFAWAYYGTPVPHTIIAKAAPHAPGELLAALAFYPWRLLSGHAALHDIFLPAYWFFGGWPAVLNWTARFITLGAALAWIWPRVRPNGRIASAAVFLGGFYVEYIPRSPWYYPGWQALAWIAWAYVFDALWQRSEAQTLPARVLPAIARVTAALTVLLQVGVLVAVAWQMRTQQTVIENGHRREIGRWLAREAQPGDRVFLECLGYIGFYSQLKMLDFPGLASPEVVAARRAGADTFARIIVAVRPDWLVLRPFDAQRIFAEQPQLQQTFALARVFDTRAAVDAVALLPGRNYLHFDSVFLVYRRGTRPPLPP